VKTGLWQSQNMKSEEIASSYSLPAPLNAAEGSPSKMDLTGRAKTYTGANAKLESAKRRCIEGAQSSRLQSTCQGNSQLSLKSDRQFFLERLKPCDKGSIESRRGVGRSIQSNSVKRRQRVVSEDTISRVELRMT